MGCSQPHPHGQIWSGSFIPEEAAVPLDSQRQYFEKHGKRLLQVYAKQEEEAKERVVCMNDTFMAVVPFWACWPFETMIIPRAQFHFRSLSDLDDKARTDLADIIRRLTCRYDNLFKCSFPYSMGVHQAPTDGGTYTGENHSLFSLSPAVPVLVCSPARTSPEKLSASPARLNLHCWPCGVQRHPCYTRMEDSYRAMRTEPAAFPRAFCD